MIVALFIFGIIAILGAAILAESMASWYKAFYLLLAGASFCGACWAVAVGLLIGAID